jgi:hypothetical protein
MHVLLLRIFCSHSTGLLHAGGWRARVLGNTAVCFLSHVLVDRARFTTDMCSLPGIHDETICMLLAFSCIKLLLFIPDMLPLAPWGRL